MRNHPVLLSEMIGVDGTRRHKLSVFCDVRLHSVPLEVCKVCPSCRAISGGALDGSGSVVQCAPPEESVPSTLPPAGRALHRGVIAVDEAVLVRDVVSLFIERGLRLVVITDVDGRAGGVVHESQLLRQIQESACLPANATRLGWESMDLEPASALMRPAAIIAESIPLRTALAAMTTAHQRQLLVVDEHGFPVGVLFDVDALHALYGRDD
jgi:CBS domain-containing protein